MSRQATQSAPVAPPAAPAADGAIARSQHLDASLEKAHRLAMSQHHGGVSLEHLLFALTEDPEALGVLGASTVDIDRLRGDITTHLGQLPSDTPPGKAILPTADLLKVLKLAATAAQQSARRTMDGAIVLAAIIGDASTPSAGLLRAHGLTFQEVIRVLQRVAAPANPPVPAAIQPPARPAAIPSAPRPSAVIPDPADEARATARPSTDDLLKSVRARLQESAPPPPPKRTEKPAPAPQRAAADAAPSTTDEAAPPPPQAQSEPKLEPSPDRTDPPTIAIERTMQVAPAAPPPAVTATAAPAAPPSPPMPPLASAPAQAVAAAASSLPPMAPADLPTTPEQLAPWPRTPADLLRAAQTPDAPPPSPSMPSPPADARSAAEAAARMPTAAPSVQPPLPLVPSAAQRSGPPPLPLPTVASPLSVAAPRGPAASAMPPASREPLRAPPIPPPTLDLRALIATLPTRLRQGQTDVIEVVVPRRSLEIPPAQGHRWPPLRVATMRLKAAPEEAHVELLSPETLWISPPRVHQGADDATWRWRVTPRNKGRIKLSLAGATRIVGSEGISGEVPLGEESVEIDVSRRGSRRGLVGLLLFGNLLAIGFLAMLMSGRATELLLAAWRALRAVVPVG